MFPNSQFCTDILNGADYAASRRVDYMPETKG